jgi:putative membrane protein
MSALVWVGRIVFAVIWGAMLANLVWPFPGKGYALFLILLFLLIALHLLQLMMFATVYREHIQWRRGDYWQILLFGVIGWLAIVQAQSKRKAS